MCGAVCGDSRSIAPQSSLGRSSTKSGIIDVRTWCAARIAHMGRAARRSARPAATTAGTASTASAACPCTARAGCGPPTSLRHPSPRTSITARSDGRQRAETFPRAVAKADAASEPAAAFGAVSTATAVTPGSTYPRAKVDTIRSSASEPATPGTPAGTRPLANAGRSPPADAEMRAPRKWQKGALLGAGAFGSVRWHANWNYFMCGRCSVRWMSRRAPNWPSSRSNCTPSPARATSRFHNAPSKHVY